MTDKKDDTSLLHTLAMLYACAAGIGSVLGVAVFFAFITFLVLNETAAFLRKISNAVWQVMS